ncbi:MAG: choline dehydrogenase [Alphaproteobacteria bacterium]|nr:choline dehydrogenase [Alphaproteobacteria bacterium]
MEPGAEFDFIVVGAGSAGCVLANRLSEDPRNRVLLMEAGGRDTSPVIHIPLLAGVAYFDPAINWGYDTEPESHLAGRRIHWPRGRVIGGSSSINGMMYVRGQAADYDHWRQLGLAGWDYASVLPYFRRSEANRDRRDLFHGAAGPWQIARTHSDNPLYAAFFQAALSAGYRETDDFNGARQEGFGWHDFNVVRGRRQSTAVAFLRPAARRNNLQVLPRAQARRVIFEAGQARSLEYAADGAVRTVRARREIILSGGAVNSPTILMHSGVGDAAQLRAWGIDVRHHAPEVGRGLQDHLGIYVQHASLQPVTMYGWFRPDRAIGMMLQVALFGRGPAASLPLQAGLFARSSGRVATPDLQITMVPGLTLDVTRKKQGRHGFLIHVYPLRPQSRGRITLASGDPAAKPKILANYLGEATDRETMRSGFHIVRRLFAQPSFAPYLGRAISPGPDVRTDDDVDRWIQDSAQTVFHPTGTCRMGADAASVVDGELRVRGVAGLRVVDASVMPTIVSGNTQAPTVMIAEKAADLILGRAAPA